jgi:hypothetical protein
MLTIGAVERAAQELAHGNGQTVPSLRLALWAAVLSSRNSIENNGVQVDNLRPYAFGGLPHDVPTVRALLAQNGARLTTRKQAQAVIQVDERAERGELAALRVLPQTEAEWLTWRDTVARFYCMSWKTASFAALLLWPFHCPFVPVDSHVCARLRHMDLYRRISGKSKPAYARYCSIEREVCDEWDAANRPCALAVWHWYKWEQHRQGDAQETLWSDTREVGSHLLLSPYLYYPARTSENV